ncbi:sensor histidine kinase [Streptomyces boncukensis]|uniref:histidine kinase n=1 Tax=Streptomyces boncukensis TaxID=2711219 RepID=A0A6G4WSZ2_9ACTN|nr:sensor histidine kinase [Streptomyces boncukensis]NGO67760.1 sensor histidine kinase [Streptomyces boncukensis]
MIPGARSRFGTLRLPRGQAADAALAGGMLVVVMVGTLPALLGERREPWATTVVGWALIVVGCGALAFRRRRPAPIALLTLVVSGVYYVTSAYDGVLLIAVVIALYTVAASGQLASALAIASLAVLSTGAGTIAGNDDVNGVALFMLAGWLVAVVALGWARHSRLEYAREVQRHAASEERLRIARELHDSIGHHLSLINVQAAAALRRWQKDPERGAQGAGSALGSVKEASREALRELRATLGALRDSGEAAPTGPVPGLERIGELVESARRAGLAARVRTSGTPEPLPAAVDRAGFRIVQEALTNVSRHAHATAATVHLGYGRRELTLEIVDDGRGSAPSGTGTGASGSGISGMRERARALGGDLTAEPGAGGGFAVRARLPYERDGMDERERAAS